MVYQDPLTLDTITATNWKNSVLDIIFNALAESDVLVDCLVFKGARVLNKRLDSFSRQSLDIDSNMLKEFVDKHQAYKELRDILEKEIELAINNYFERQSPVTYELNTIKITKKPHKDRNHKLGWDAFEVTISVRDLSRTSMRGLPNLKIDISAPEDLGEDSIAPLNIGNSSVKAYSLERIAGEKLRAFLSSLPEYRKKVSKPGNAIRAKDLYDISQILKQYPITQDIFWNKVGEEFLRACQSRYIDCEGIKTFAKEMTVTEETFNSEPSIPKDISFNDVWNALTDIIEKFERTKITPFNYPLPNA